MPANAKKVELSKKRKLEFSARLKLAASRANPPAKGATPLSVQFNLRFDGRGVSPQTAHKWWSGRAIPTPDKIEVLAEWMGVSAHWLQFGPVPDTDQGADRILGGVGGDPSGTIGARVLAERIDALAPQQRFLVEQLIIEFSDKGR